MPPREWHLRIEDILDAAGRAQRYVVGMELEAFIADDRTLDAVSLPEIVEPLRKLLAEP